MDRGLNPGLGVAVLRVVLGVIFVAHGWPKLFGGMEMTAGMFDSLGIPVPTLAAWAIALLETVGGLALIVGFMVTPTAALLSIHMLTGIILVHSKNGFYVVGEGAGGVEFSLLIIAAMVALVFAGPGIASLDAKRAQSDVVIL